MNSKPSSSSLIRPRQAHVPLEYKNQAMSVIAERHNNQKAAEAVQEARVDLTQVRRDCWKLYKFVKLAWPHVPALNHVEFVSGWHIAYICEHLEAISKGIFLELNLENRLQINVPPGMMKSLLVSVFWPAWEWTMWPETQYIVTSYRDEFCKRDTIRMRDLVLSPWYQMLPRAASAQKGQTKRAARLKRGKPKEPPRTHIR